MSKWVQGTVVGNRRWTALLHSLQVLAPEVAFVAGQFGRLALPALPGSTEDMTGRPYSFVNAPGTSPHEFYLVVVPGGPLSERLAVLSPGDAVWLLRTANGFFSISEVPDAEVLWCLATGTGLGPFLSWEIIRINRRIHERIICSAGLQAVVGQIRDSSSLAFGSLQSRCPASVLPSQ